MRYKSIHHHLKPYDIVKRRTTTINHAFAASVAPCDAYDDARVREAMVILGQDPDADLICVYCGGEAETWDHVNATVHKTKFSGHGHRLGNLLPCCKPCNSKKGNKDWQVFLQSLKISEQIRVKSHGQIKAYLEKYGVTDPVPEQSAEYQELLRLRIQVLELFSKADELAKIIRNRSRIK